MRQTPVPLIADIHFDYRWALAAIRAGFHGLRLNPGNIRDVDKVKTVVKEAKERGIPIRIGVNAGSLPPIPALKDGELPPTMVDRMVDAALWEIKILEEMDYDNIKISLKAFDVPVDGRGQPPPRRALVPYPLHLGVTEAGTPRAGSVRSAIGIGIAARGGHRRHDPRLAGGRPEGRDPGLLRHPRQRWTCAATAPTLVACPTCGRIEIELIPLAQKVEEHFDKLGKPITVAVMGCVVNGPGEARWPTSASPAARDAASSSARARSFAPWTSRSSSAP